jgi:hypothetical protein
VCSHRFHNLTRGTFVSVPLLGPLPQWRSAKVGKGRWDGQVGGDA